MKNSKNRERFLELVRFGIVLASHEDIVCEAMEIASDGNILEVDSERGRAFGAIDVIDDSTSMRENQKHLMMFDELARSKDELLETQNELEEIFYYTSFGINSGVLTPWSPLSDATYPTEGGVKFFNTTPLLERMKQVLGGVFLTTLEYAQSARQFQSFITVISDGEFNDQAKHSPDDVAELIKAVTRDKNHTICGVAIGSTAKESFLKMGIPEGWILDTSEKAFDFRSAYQKLSRRSREFVTKGRVALEMFADEGFRDN